jgi:hypothetical protein
VEVLEVGQEIVALVVDKTGALAGLGVGLEITGGDVWAWDLAVIDLEVEWADMAADTPIIAMAVDMDVAKEWDTAQNIRIPGTRVG